jgi:acyl-ACP thioesterase
VDDELVAEPAAGRVFECAQMPGIADAVGSGRVRLDAIARWLTDVAYLDVIDAGFEQRGLWIVRRLRIRVESWPRFGEEVRLRTFCSGIGRFSAERRTSISGGAARVEAVAIWVWIDAETQRPLRFEPRFAELYGASAGDRPAPTRLRHPSPPASAVAEPWAFRATDIDVADHVNNSHYLAPIEAELTGGEPGPPELEIEFRQPAQAGEAVVLSDGRMRWVAALDGSVHASIELR